MITDSGLDGFLRPDAPRGISALKPLGNLPVNVRAEESIFLGGVLRGKLQLLTILSIGISI